MLNANEMKIFLELAFKDCDFNIVTDIENNTVSIRRDDFFVSVTSVTTGGLYAVYYCDRDAEKCNATFSLYCVIEWIEKRCNKYCKKYLQ